MVISYCLRSLICFFLLWLLVNHVQHLSFDCFLFHGQSILVPQEICVFSVKSVPLHAAFEQTDDIGIIRILSKCKASTIVHKFLEFFWSIFTEFIDLDLFLLLLNISILFSFRSSWKALPWKRSLNEVEKHVANTF